jgi:predicted negative regulator of RcsB-dependent stress response
MNKYLIFTVIFIGLMGFGWMYFLTNQVTKYDTAIETCIHKMDSLETRTHVLEALVEKQSEQNNKHEVTIYLKTK